MRTIYKYIMAEQCVTFQVPKGSLVLDAKLQEQGSIKMEEPVIWFLVGDKNAEVESRTFAYFMTGQAIPDAVDIAHINTLIAKNGIVVHVFEVTY